MHNNGQPAAYVYQADIMCPGCMRKTAATVLGFSGTSVQPVEELLDRWADRADVNRYDEGSYDSGDFPKTAFYYDLYDDELCGVCWEEL